ncbi:MAG: xanthine dehydrogenase family protein subunit M [Myxococcota bacterium]
MHSFDVLRASTVKDALHEFRQAPHAKFVAGGTNLVDLMKEGVENPKTLIDINRIDELRRFEFRDDGSIYLGALVSNSDIAWHEEIARRLPMVSEAILAGATTQLRNMATVGGNLLQKNRCFYYPELHARCNKRDPGAGCDAIDGVHRMCAVLGTSDACIAAHPSDLCVPLRALDAVVHTQSVEGFRSIDLRDFYKLPGETPDIEFELQPGELIVGVEIPASPIARRSTYLKLRDRTSYAFALVSVAAALEVDGGRIRDVRLALGGVGTVPWREEKAEAAMRGEPATAATFARAGEIVFRDAVSRPGNGFKVELAKRAIVRVLTALLEQTP